MRMLSVDAEAASGKAMALFPLRRSMVPKHVRFDKCSLSQVLEALRNERLGRSKRKRGVRRGEVYICHRSRCACRQGQAALPYPRRLYHRRCHCTHPARDGQGFGMAQAHKHAEAGSIRHRRAEASVAAGALAGVPHRPLGIP